MTSIRHVCFDKDGTLIDVHLYWSDIIHKRAQRMVDQFGLPSEAGAQLSRAMGIDPSGRKILPEGPVGYKPRPVIIQAALSALSRWQVKATSDEIASIFVAVDQWMQANSAYEIRLLPQVKEALGEFKKAGFKMSVYTSDRRENLRKILISLELESYFDALVGGDDVQKGKPHPEGFLIACQKMGFTPQQSAYVGDTCDDMTMSKNAQAAAAFGVATGLDSKEELEKHTRCVVHSLDQLPAIILKG